MVAIKSGEPGEDKLKKYDPFSTEVSSSDGTLDISSLVPLEAVEKPSAPSSIPEPLVLLPNPLQQIKRDVSPPSGVSTPPDSALCDLSSPYMVSECTFAALMITVEVQHAMQLQCVGEGTSTVLKGHRNYMYSCIMHVYV